MPIAKWSQVVGSPEWQQVSPDQREDIRLGWMKSVLAENPDWGPDKVKELIAVTQQYQPEGQPQEQIQQDAQVQQAQNNGQIQQPTGQIQQPTDQPIAPPPEVTSTGELDLSDTPTPPADSNVMQPALPADQPQPIQEPQVQAQDGGMPSAKDFLSGTAEKARKIYETTPFASVARGYEEDGIPGAIGRALGYPFKMARGLIEDFTKRDALMKTIGTLNALQAGVVEGIKDKRMEISDTNWHEQPPEDRLIDIKETIANEGMRHTFGDAVLIPLGFSLPDKLRDIILNQSASGRTPAQIDKIIVDAMEAKELGDIPKVVPRHSKKTKNEETGALISPATDPFGAMGVAFKDLITEKGLRKGITQSMQGKVVSVSDIRKAVKGNTLEERLGTANGIALSILGDMLTDPLIVASLPRQVVQGIANKIAKGQVKKAYKILAGIMDGEKYAKEAERIKLFKRFKEKGHSQRFNVLKDALEGSKQRGRKQLTSGQKAIGEAPEPKALTPARKAIELPEAGKPTKTYLDGKEVDHVIPAGPSPEGAVRQAIREGTAYTEGKIVRKPIAEAPGHPRKALGEGAREGQKAIAGVERKAIGPAKATPLPSAKIPLTASQEAMSKKVEKFGMTVKGVGEDGKIHIHSNLSGSTGSVKPEDFTTSKMKEWAENSVQGAIKGMDDFINGGNLKKTVSGAKVDTVFDQGEKYLLKIPDVGIQKVWNLDDLDSAGIAKVKKWVDDELENLKRFSNKTEPPQPIKTPPKGTKGKGAREGIRNLKNKWNKQGVKLELHETKKNSIILDNIYVAGSKRASGLGTKAMDDIIAFADKQGKILEVTPDVAFGATSKARLEKFYKRFGFVKNTGKKAKHELSESMYRIPQEKGVKIKPLKEPPKGGKKPIELGQGKIIDGKFPEKTKLPKGYEEIPLVPGEDLSGINPKTGEIERTAAGLKFDKEQIEKQMQRFRDYDQKMWNKGYRYRVNIPSNMSEPLYAKTVKQAKDLVKEYGTKGIKVQNLAAPKLSTIEGGIKTPKKPITKPNQFEPEILTREQTMNKFEQEAMDRFAKAKPAPKVPKEIVEQENKAYNKAAKDMDIVDNVPPPEDPNLPRNSGGGGDNILPSFLGGLQTFFEHKAGRNLTADGLARWNKAPFSIVKPWKEIGFEDVGEAIKNLYSFSEGVTEYGQKWMSRLSKIGQTGRHNLKSEKFTMIDGKLRSMKYTDDDLAEIALLANNKERWKNLPHVEKVRLQEGVKLMRNFFEDFKGKYGSLGADIDFKKRMMDIHEEQIGALAKIADDLRKTPIQEYDRAILKGLGFEVKGLPKQLSRKEMVKFIKENTESNIEIIKRLEKMEYVHIPFDMWFETGKINKSATLKALKIANAHKRKTILIDDLLEAGAIKKGDINAFDIMASYTHRASKDLAMLQLKKIARGQGLVSTEKLAGFKKLPVFQAPMFHDVYMHPAMIDWMMDFKFQSFNVNNLDKVFSSVKMWQFAKPLFLPYYDLAQWAAARAFSNPLTVFRDARKAFNMMKNKTPEFFEAMSYGLPSRPIEVPWDQFTDTINKFKGTTMGDWMAAQLKNKNWTVVKPVYNALWETAWMGDRFIRLNTYNYFVDTLKMSKPKAAQLAALFHSDYANVPIEMRRQLNKVFFTPTFKITMMRLYKEMGKAMIAVPAKKLMGKALTTQEKQLAKGGVFTTVGMMYGFDWIMQNALGYERDQFARRYFKRVDDPDNPGEKKDHVVVFSNPLTMLPKYYQKGAKIYEGLGHDDKLRTIIDTMKWEIHPIYRIGYEIASNKKANGEPIVVPYDDDEGILPLKKGLYALKESFKVLEQIPAFKEDESVEAFNAWAKDAGFLFSTITSPATFSYYRSPEVRKQKYLIDRRKKEFMQSMKRLGRKGDMTPERELRMMRNYEKQLERDIEQFDKLLADYDKGVMGQIARDAVKRREREKARQKNRKEKIKPPTPFISVPGYTPPPGS